MNAKLIRMAIVLGLLSVIGPVAIDMYLPALPEIGGQLGVTDASVQLSLMSFMAAFAVGQLLYGPVSDMVGRKPPLYIGTLVFIAGSIGCAVAPSVEWLIVARFVQGIGAASTRVIAVSMVRDRFGGRAMAEVMSLIFMVFMVIPVVAPSIGQLVMIFANWHMIFMVMAVIATAIALWTFIRMPETQHPEDRRQIDLGSIAQGFGIVLSNRLSLGYTLASTSVFAALFGFINSAPQVYIGIYQLGYWFPVLFAAIAGMMAVSSFLNSRLVMRLGMRRLSHGALIGFTIVSTIWFVLSLFGPVPLPLFVLLFALAMFQFGWIGSNFNAIAMEPLGHIAGTAASIQGFIQTLGGGLIGAGIGQAFDGTVTPLAAGFCGVGIVGLAFVLIAERGRLFTAPNAQQAVSAELSH